MFCDYQEENSQLYSRVKSWLMEEYCGMSEKGEEERRREAFKAFMAKRGFKAAPWAEAAGISPNTLYHYLKGRSSSLHHDTARKLAEHAGVTIPELFGDAPLRGELRGDDRFYMQIAVSAIMKYAGELNTPPDPATIASAIIGVYENLRYSASLDEIEEPELKAIAFQAFANSMNTPKNGNNG